VRRAASIAWVLVLAGCGYHFVGAGLLPDGVRSVRAPIFRNHTSEPSLELAFTEAFRGELERRGELGAAAADGELQGEILAVGGTPTLLTSDHVLASYRLTATVRLRLVRNGKVLSAADVSGFEDYLPAQAGDVLLSEANRQAALKRLADTLAREGLDRLSTASG
jgi:outer membrane lipopolysaccharide assembly protein LptE/RlpB